MPNGFEKSQLGTTPLGDLALRVLSSLGARVELPSLTRSRASAARRMPGLDVPKVEEDELLPPSGRAVKTSVIFGTVPGRGNQKWILEICLLP